MEIADDNIKTLYQNYIYGNDISLALKIYKNKDCRIDLLEILKKYESTFPSKKMIKSLVNYNDFGLSFLMNLLLSYFIDYFSSLNIDLTNNLLKDLGNSYLTFILSYIITDKNDKIENYPVLWSTMENIDKYFEEDFKLLFIDFINYCIDFIDNNNINNNLNYTIKILDFISKIREGNENDIFYLFIRPLIFEVANDNEIKLKLEIEKYKENKEIRDDIRALIQNNNKDNNNNENKFGTNEYEYFKFIQKCSQIKGSKDNSFKSLYLILLNTQNLFSFIKNSDDDEIKNYQLDKILINNNTNIETKNNTNNIDINKNDDNLNINKNINILNNIQNNNIKDDSTNNKIIEGNNENNNSSNGILQNNNIQKDNNKIEEGENKINKLKDDLKDFSIYKYLSQQINKYSIQLNDDSIFLNFEKNFKIKNYIYNSIDKNTFPIVFDIYSYILNYINNLNQNYNKTFGFIVIDNKEYLYAYHNNEIINNFLLEHDRIKKVDYIDIINNKDLSESESMKSENSTKTFNSFHKENTISENTKINKSYSEHNFVPKVDEISHKEYNISYFKGIEFENNATFLFNNLFHLPELPNYFFVLKNKLKKTDKIFKKGVRKNKKEYLNFKEYTENLFTTFIETDGAYINNKNEPVTPILKNNLHPILVQNTFEISKINEEYKVNSIDEGLEIGPKTIILNESKLSIPKNIDKFSFEEAYDKNKLSNTLIFTLNKFIQKKHYYYEFVKNEILNNPQEIIDYKFLFCLIYNNIPIKNINEIIKNDLQTLIDKGYIKDEFKIKIIYVIPNLGTYNLNLIQTEVENNKNKIKELETEIKELKLNNQKEINELNLKNQKKINDLELKNQKEINELREMFIIQKSQIKMQNELIMHQLTNSEKEINKNNQ